MKTKLLIWASLLMLLSPVAQATGWQIGGGGQSVSFDDDLEDVDTGFGPVFSAAYQQSGFFAFDFAVGGSIHDEDRANEQAFYSYAMAGGKFSPSEGNIRPYFVFGITINDVNFDEFDNISGTGTYWGVGADFQVKSGHSVNVSFRSSDWDGEDDVFDYDVSNDYFIAAYNFHF